MMEVRRSERKYSLLCICNWRKIGVIQFAISYVAIYRLKSRRVLRPEAVITSGFCSVFLRTWWRYGGLRENIIIFVCVIWKNRRDWFRDLRRVSWPEVVTTSGFFQCGYGGLSENIAYFVYVIGEKSAWLNSRLPTSLFTGLSRVASDNRKQ